MSDTPEESTEEQALSEGVDAATLPVKKEVVAIEPGRLKFVWPEIRPLMDRIERPDHAIPEEVFLMCATNQATLFRMFIEDRPVGFMVLRVIMPDLHIWQVWSENGYEVLHEFRDVLMDVAKKVGATHITFGSNRRAWQEVAPKHGFKTRMIVYECPVE